MSAFRFSGSILALFTLALLPFAQRGNSANQVLLSPPGGRLFAEGDDLEGDLNCDEVVFVSSGLKSIVQNVPANGAEFAAHMRRRAKVLVQTTVLRSESLLHSYHAQGVLAGLEFDWFFPHGNQPPTEFRLPGVVEVFAPLPGGEARLVARVYAYDAVQYAERRAAVQAMMSHPMRSYRVWTEDVLSSSGREGGWLAITGFGNELHGRAVSGSSFALSGMQNRLPDGASAAGETYVHPENHLAFLLEADLRSVPGVPFSEAAARAQALSSGTYAAGDLVLDEGNLPPAGVVFAEGSIVVQASSASGRYTLVSGAGSVHFRGDSSSFQPFLSNVLAVSYAGRVVLAGDGNQMEGELIAPLGSLEVSGSENTLLGILVGAGARVSGSANVFTDGTHTIPLPQ